MVALKNKTSDEVVRAFESIFKERASSKMQKDLEKSFITQRSNSKVLGYGGEKS